MGELDKLQNQLREEQRRHEEAEERASASQSFRLHKYLETCHSLGLAKFLAVVVLNDFVVYSITEMNRLSFYPLIPLLVINVVSSTGLRNPHHRLILDHNSSEV